MNNIGIYKISSPNGFYIGSSKNIRKRFQDHLSSLRRGKHCNQVVQRAFDKNDSKLDFSIIELCSESTLLEREQHYIDTLKPRYNICLVAGRMDGFKFSEESKAKMRGRKVDGQKVREGIFRNYTREQLSERAKKARAAWTEESKEKQRKSLTGRKIPKEIYEKTRKHLIGRPVSAETRAKIAMQKGWKQKPEVVEAMRARMIGKTGAECPNSKLIVCSNGMNFHGAVDAQRWLRENGHPKAHAGRITAVCRGERNKTYGMTWRYANA